MLLKKYEIVPPGFSRGIEIAEMPNHHAVKITILISQHEQGISIALTKREWYELCGLQYKFDVNDPPADDADESEVTND